MHNGGSPPLPRKRTPTYRRENGHMSATADDSLDAIRRYTDHVIRDLKDPAYTQDMKIHSLELYVEYVEDELDLRPPRKRRRRFT